MPHEENAFTRREFLHSGLAMVSTVATVPTFLARAGVALAGDTTMRLGSRPGVPDERVLVVVQLSGGNDGLNTVIPYGLDRYHRSRPGLGVAESDVLPIDVQRGIGLHPALVDLRDMMGEGLATAVQGVGYPNPNRSHFASMDVWHTGDTDTGGSGGRGHGWIGRALDASDAIDPSLGCVSIGSEAPLATAGKLVRPVAFERADLFRWAGRDLHPALDEAYDAIYSAPVDGRADDPTGFVMRTAMDAQVASARVRAAVAAPAQTRFPNGALSRQLKAVAAMIGAELPTRVYYVALGGFDTHANQGGRHQRLLGEFGGAMRAFYAELGATGHDGRVVTLAFSEFGRRVAQNASGGTDHGAAGPVFVFGRPVVGSLVGEHPSLTDLDKGDLKFGIDFRSVYAELLDGWMKLDSTAALGRSFKPVRILS